MSTCNTVIQLVPGPPGQNGAAGAQGIDGEDGFTQLTADFTMPIGGSPYGPPSTATVVSTDAFFSGEIIQLENAGYLEVVTIVNSTQMTLHNLEEYFPGWYPGNAADGTIIPAGSRMVASGPQGADGAAGTNGTNGTNGASAWTTLTATYTMPAEGATAVATVVSTAGMAVGETIFLETAGFVQVTAIGSGVLVTLMNLENTAGQRYTANVAPGTIIAIGSKAISGGVQGPIGATGATGAAGAAGPAGSTSLLYAIYQQVLASASAGAPLGAAWATVPLNTEVSDAGNIGVLAASQVTLASGSYRFKWNVPLNFVNACTTRLYNVTTAAEIQRGHNGRSDINGVIALCWGEARVTFVGATVVRVEAYGQTTNAGSAIGYPGNFGFDEVYSGLEIWKE